MKYLIIPLLLVAGFVMALAPVEPALAQGSCNNASPSFFGLPTWYKYLDCDAGGAPVVDTSQPEQLWLIGAAILEIMTRIAGILAVIFVVVGGFRYITSAGAPDATAQARKTIIYSLVGLAVSIIAASTVSYIANEVSGSADANAITSALNIFYGIAAAVAGLMVVVGGLRFATANGDPGIIGSARNTIIYALIGLVVVLFAAVITGFVVNSG